MTQPRYETLVGSIVGAHGVQGTVKVKLATATALAMLAPPRRDNADAPRPTVDVFVGESPDSGRIRQVVSVKRQHPKEIYLVRFVETTRREEAEALMGLRLFAPDDRRVPLGADEFYVQDLIGLNVVTDADRSLGRLTQVLPNPANDVYETDAGALIPAVKAFILKIDAEAGTMLVRDVPGLLPGEQEAITPVEGDAEGPVESEGSESKALARISGRRFGGKR